MGSSSPTISYTAVLSCNVHVNCGGHDILMPNQMSSLLIPMLATPVLSWEPGGARPSASEMKVKCSMGGYRGGSGIGRPLPASFAKAYHIRRSSFTLVGMGNITSSISQNFLTKFKIGQRNHFANGLSCVMDSHFPKSCCTVFKWIAGEW